MTAPLPPLQLPHRILSRLAAPPAWLALLLVTLILYVPGTASLPLMDRDEPRFAHATVEMMERGEWLIPYFNNEYRFDKPPLTYWWMRLHYNLFGIHELAARLHTVVAVWLVALAIFRMACDLFSRRAAWWAALGWLTCLQALVHGRLCVADMPMVLAVTLTMAATMALLTNPSPSEKRFSGLWWLLWISVGAGFLTKGPIALLVPALSLALWRFAFWRKPAPWRRLQAGTGLLLALALVAAWGIPALIQTGGKFWDVGMGEHVVKRGTQAFNGRIVLPFYYFLTAFLSLLPWIAFLPAIIRHTRAHWSAPVSLLVSWFAAPYLIFLLYATQLPHYVMPGFPAFFLLMGAFFATQSPAFSPPLGRFGWIYFGLVLGLAAVVIALAWGSGWFPDSGIRWVVTGVGMLLAGLAALALAARRLQRPAMGVSLLLVSITLCSLTTMLRPSHAVVQISPLLKDAPQGRELVAWRFTEPSLVFYSGRPWRMLSRLERVEARLITGKAGAAVLLRREWTLSKRIEQIRSGQPSLPATDNSSEVDALTAAYPGYESVTVQGYNLARSSWVELRVLMAPASPGK
jgi:4-amino-4-deoxy-L-arabinose transferase-like glycosyltransferase